MKWDVLSNDIVILLVSHLVFFFYLSCSLYRPACVLDFVHKIVEDGVFSILQPLSRLYRYLKGKCFIWEVRHQSGFHWDVLLLYGVWSMDPNKSSLSPSRGWGNKKEEEKKLDACLVRFPLGCIQEESYSTTQKSIFMPLPFRAFNSQFLSYVLVQFKHF